VTSIQNIPGRKRVEAITISRQTRSKLPSTGLGAQCGAGHNKTAPQSPADDVPPIQLHAPLLHAPSADASGRATWLVHTPHEPTVTRMARSSGPAAPPLHPTAMHKAFIAALKQVKTGKFDAERRRAMMTFAALVVAAILVVSILYAMFSRAR
jgi:hypothetical protein